MKKTRRTNSEQTSAARANSNNQHSGQGVVLNPEVIYSVCKRQHCIPGCAVTIKKINEKTHSCLGDEGLEGEVGCTFGEAVSHEQGILDFRNIFESRTSPNFFGVGKQAETGILSICISSDPWNIPANLQVAYEFK